MAFFSSNVLIMIAAFANLEGAGYRCEEISEIFVRRHKNVPSKRLRHDVHWVHSSRATSNEASEAGFTAEGFCPEQVRHPPLIR